MPSKVWDEITYPFPNFNGATVEVWEWISNFDPNLLMDLITYSCKEHNLQYIPENMHMVWLCFVLLWWYYQGFLFCYYHIFQCFPSGTGAIIRFSLCEF